MVAAAVDLPERLSGLAKAGLTDSKQLTREQREQLDKRIRQWRLRSAWPRWTLRRSTVSISTRRREWLCWRRFRDWEIVPDHLLIHAMRAGPSLQTDKTDLWRLTEPFDCGGFGRGQGVSGCVDARFGPDHPGYGLASHKAMARRSIGERWLNVAHAICTGALLLQCVQSIQMRSSRRRLRKSCCLTISRWKRGRIGIEIDVCRRAS